MKTTSHYIAYPLFSNFIHPLPLLPCHLQPLPPLFFLLSCFFGWMGDHCTFGLLFYLMIIWIYICLALVPWYQKDLDMCFRHATRHQVYWGLTHVFFCWYSDLISPAQGPVDWQTYIYTYKYIFTPPFMW